MTHEHKSMHIPYCACGHPIICHEEDRQLLLQRLEAYSLGQINTNPLPQHCTHTPCPCDMPVEHATLTCL